MTSPCNEDVSGLPEWARRAYYQEHKTHDCLWADSEAHPVKPRRLGVMLTLRMSSDQVDQLRARARDSRKTLSEIVRDELFPNDHVCDPSKPDCAAYLFYADEKNRKAHGRGRRRNTESGGPSRDRTDDALG